MIFYIRTILYQYSAYLSSKEYKERYESIELHAYAGYSKYNEGVLDKAYGSIQYNWRPTSKYRYISDKHCMRVAVLPRNI